MTGLRRVLYIDLAASVGGSVISLYELVKGLDRGRYEPHVVLRATNPYLARFRELGVVVTPLGQEGTPAQDEQKLVARARRGGLAQWLKRNPAGERLVHLVGFYVRSYPSLCREAQALERILRAVRPDLVHVNDVICVSRAAIMATRKVALPALCHLRALAERSHFDRWLSRSLKGFICISQAVQRHERGLGGRTEPSWVVYNGLDLADFDQVEDDTLERAKLGFGPEEQVVGCIGRLVAWKGQRVFLRALGRLAPHRPSLRGLIVGGSEAGETAYAQELAELVRQLGLEGKVTFAGFRRDVPCILRAMDVLVHASTAPEPFGRVIIEGMAAGRPVIGADGGAVPEIIEDKVTGLLVPPGDERALAEAIAWVLDHPQERKAMCLAARRAVEIRFTTEQYVRGVESVYEELFR